MKLVVALALSAHAFSPATPGGAKPRQKKPFLVVDENGLREGYVIPYTPSPRHTSVRAGFNTVTLTDCCATTSAEGQAGATGGTFGMFSDPMTADDFVAKL